jgi:hypothetical protein
MPSVFLPLDDEDEVVPDEGDVDDLADPGPVETPGEGPREG